MPYLIFTGRQVRYWKENGAALTVEATAYALLAQLKLKEVEFSGPVVIWLTEERNARGSFHSTQVCWFVLFNAMTAKEAVHTFFL